MNRRLRRIVFLGGVLVLPLGLTACGVKGPLSPPQASAVAEPGEPAPAPIPSTPSGNPMAGNTRSPAVVNAPNATRPSPLDWLIN